MRQGSCLRGPPHNKCVLSEQIGKRLINTNYFLKLNILVVNLILFCLSLNCITYYITNEHYAEFTEYFMHQAFVPGLLVDVT